MNFAAQPYGGAMGGLEARKQALVKKLSGQRAGAGSQAQSGATPFGALPRLGFSPNARSAFAHSQERQQFDQGNQGMSDLLSQFQDSQGIPSLQGPDKQSPQQGGGQQMASLAGVGPGAGGGQSAPSANPFGSPTQDTGGTQHLLENGPQTGGAPGNSGSMSVLSNPAFQGVDPSILAFMMAHGLLGGMNGGGGGVL